MSSLVGASLNHLAPASTPAAQQPPGESVDLTKSDKLTSVDGEDGKADGEDGKAEEPKGTGAQVDDDEGKNVSPSPT